MALRNVLAISVEEGKAYVEIDETSAKVRTEGFEPDEQLINELQISAMNFVLRNIISRQEGTVTTLASRYSLSGGGR